MSVKELKNELRVRGWGVSGVKTDLMERLEIALTWDEDEDGLEDLPETVINRDPAIEQYLRKELDTLTASEMRLGLERFNITRGKAFPNNSRPTKQQQIKYILDTSDDQRVLDIVEYTRKAKKKAAEEKARVQEERARVAKERREAETQAEELKRQQQEKAAKTPKYTLTNYPGVLWREGAKKWEAITMHEGKQAFVGLFSTENAAWTAVKSRREKLNWPPLSEPREGWKFSLYPGVLWNETEGLWVANAEHLDLKEHIGFFSSRAEAWFELQKYRESQNWPLLSPTMPIQVVFPPTQAPVLADNAHEGVSRDPETETATEEAKGLEESSEGNEGGVEADEGVDVEMGMSSEEWKKIVHESNLMVLTLGELKDEARSRGLSPRGTKADIVERLERLLRAPEDTFDNPAENSINRLERLAAILDETLNYKFDYEKDVPDLSEEELQQLTVSNDTDMARLATLALTQEEMVKAEPVPEVQASNPKRKRPHPLEDALDLSPDDLQKLRTISRKYIKQQEKMLKKKTEAKMALNEESFPIDGELPFDWNAFNRDLETLRKLNGTKAAQGNNEFGESNSAGGGAVTPPSVTNPSPGNPEKVTAEELGVGTNGIQDLVQLLDIAKGVSKREEIGGTDQDLDEDIERILNPIDAPVDEQYDRIRQELGEEAPIPKLKTSERKLADRLIMVLAKREMDEWPKLLKDSEIWRAQSNITFIRLRQRIAKCSNLEDEWILRVLERDLKTMHQQLLDKTGPFADTWTSDKLRKAAIDWSDGGTESMSETDRRLCDKLVAYFQSKDPSEWFSVLRDSKTWPAIAERFFYRLRARIRAERNDNQAKKLSEMRDILREAHQQVYGVEAPDMASLDSLGPDYRNIKQRGRTDVDGNTQYYWNKVIGGSGKKDK
uniref:SAP domain-containing protein n=1 Tax=Amorphochlora amoebiformis TaxID=1561963 RepID=A0A7S0GZV9_9EUKA